MLVPALLIVIAVALIALELALALSVALLFLGVALLATGGLWLLAGDWLIGLAGGDPWIAALATLICLMGSLGLWLHVREARPD